jgi:hypothetical protein
MLKQGLSELEKRAEINDNPYDYNPVVRTAITQ